MSLSVRVKVTGQFACWTRPEAKVERTSYECMTPSAARNILDAICWRPQMRWVVTRISILRPVQFIALRRNEVQSKVSPTNIRKWMEDPSEFSPFVAGAGSAEVTQRNTLALKDVAYIIDAYPLVYTPTDENHAVKFISMMNRRVEKGQCFQRPSLGCREFAAEFFPVEDSDQPIASLDIDLGRMLYDVVFRETERRPVFFDAKVRGGVLITEPENCIGDADLRQEVLACSYKR